MSIEKLIILTIAASFVLFVSVENLTTFPKHLDQPAGNFTLNQFTGEWYEIAVIYSMNETPYLKCDWFHIMWNKINDQGFYEVYTKFDDVKGVRTIEGYGNILNSELRITFLDFRDHVQAFAVTGYNNGEDLILIHKKEKMYSGLVSRDPAKVSLAAKAEIERLAGEAGGQAIYYNHSNCPRHLIPIYSEI